MDMLSKYLKHVTSALYTCILLWKAKLPFPSKRHRSGKGKVQAGLKTLVRSEEKARPRVVHRCTVEETTESEPSSPPPPPLSWLWSPSSPAIRTSMLGDVIGTESGDCMITDEGELRAEYDQPRKVMRRRERRREREFPPPITLLRETGEMPWTLEREYSGDGRLIITAVPERVTRGHEYCVMEAHREDGRLTMKFAPEEDGDYCEECGYPIDDEEEDLEFNEGFEEEECGFEFEEELAKEASNERELCGDLRECVTYDDAGPGPGPEGLVQLHHSVPFLKGTGFGDLNTCLGRPASAPLRPITPVM